MTEASKKLEVTHVSRHIAGLEEELNTKLVSFVSNHQDNIFMKNTKNL